MYAGFDPPVVGVFFAGQHQHQVRVLGLEQPVSFDQPFQVLVRRRAADVHDELLALKPRHRLGRVRYSVGCLVGNGYFARVDTCESH